jgi:hypothetical protein
VPAVDVHQHLWPERFVEALRQRRRPPLIDDDRLVLDEGTFAVPPGIDDVRGCLRALERAEIDVAVVSLQPTLGTGELPPDERDELELAWIDGTREHLAASGGRLRAFAPNRVLPGFAGVSVAARALDDLDGIRPLLDELEAGAGCLFVHPGPPRAAEGGPPWWASVVDYTAQMQRAYFRWLVFGRPRWPELRVVFAILAGGAPFQLERLAQRGRAVRTTLDEKVFLDVATYGRRAIELCAETFGVRRLVYGSDRPLVDPNLTLRAVRGFGESVATLVCTDNPSELLP